MNGDAPRQRRFVGCPGCSYRDWDWREVATHLRRHHDLDPPAAERVAREALETASG